MSVGNLDAGRAAKPPSVDIVIDRHYSSKVYTSGSTITGHAVIKTCRNLPFDAFEISFTGTSSTRLDYVQSFPAFSRRTFMKLRMPHSEIQSSLPDGPRGVFVAGRTYEVPFHFVVPHQLTIGACNHKCESPAVREQHLRPPPSVGVGAWSLPDQSPDMVRVEYAIRVRAGEQRAVTTGPGAAGASSGGLDSVIDAQHLIKVLPATPEDAPIDVTLKDERYNLSKTKTLRKSLLFSGKMGSLAASSSQPAAIMLSPDGHRATDSVAYINLDFTPSSSDATPPRISSVAGKLVSTTFFSSLPIDALPNLGGRSSYTTTPALNYSSNTNIFTVNSPTTVWRPRRPALSGLRRDSGYESSHVDGEDASDLSDNGSGGEGRGWTARVGRRKSNAQSGSKKSTATTVTTTVEIPFTLPMTNKKMFLPTFHSCLVSRTYTLQVVLSVGPNNTAVQLAIPIQIGVEAAHAPQDMDELPSFETAMMQGAVLSEDDADADADADAYLRPRVMHIPPPESLGTSILPGYHHRGGAISVN
jgi:hypothetical protein